MVRIARKGERAEPQSIQGRELQETKTGIRGSEMGQVVFDQVVAQNDVCPFAEFVEFLQRCRQPRTRMQQPLAGIRPHRPEGVDAAVLLADLKVERKRAKIEAHRFLAFAVLPVPGSAMNLPYIGALSRPFLIA